MKKLLKFVLILTVLLIVGIFFLLAYLGVVPGVSAVFMKQKDLGVVPIETQVTEINQEIGHEILLTDSEIPSSSGPVYEGEIELTGSYSDQQVTSVLDSWSKNWTITPFYNVQVKIHDDGTAEASGMLKVQEAINLAKQLGYSDEQIAVASKYATFVSGDLPVYVSGTAEVNNNQVSARTSTIKIGNVTLPANISSQIVVAVEDAVERRLSQVPSLNLQKMDLNGGKLNLVGKIPQTERGN